MRQSVPLTRYRYQTGENASLSPESLRSDQEMEELWFHLSNQLELLQVHISITAQQGQQWLSVWLVQIQEFLRNLPHDRNVQHVMQNVRTLLQSLQRVWEQFLHQYYSTRVSLKGFYRQLGYLFVSQVSRREVAFCLGGIVVGSLAGYYIGVNRRAKVSHVPRMRAVICRCYIGIEGALMIDDAEMPTIAKSDEVMIQVKAASVNVVDARICDGYARTYRSLLNSGKFKNLPVTLGRDCAGVVVNVGHGVRNFDVGDEVLLAVPSWAPGTMADYIVVPECSVVKMPNHFTFAAAATFPYSGCLAWDAIVNRSVIKEGDAKGKRVLVCGGNTPIGCILTQLVKLWGGHVVAICRDRTAPCLRALGAAKVICSDDTDIEKELQLHDPFDAIFHAGGEPIEERILRQRLTFHGSYVSVVPGKLTSDSLGFVCGSIFAGYIRVKLLIQHILGFSTHHWNEGSSLRVSYLQALCDLADTMQLQVVADKLYGPHNIELALHHVLDPEAIGSTIIAF